MVDAMWAEVDRIADDRASEMSDGEWDAMASDCTVPGVSLASIPGQSIGSRTRGSCREPDQIAVIPSHAQTTSCENINYGNSLYMIFQTF